MVQGSGLRVQRLRFESRGYRVKNSTGQKPRNALWPQLWRRFQPRGRGRCLPSLGDEQEGGRREGEGREGGREGGSRCASPPQSARPWYTPPPLRVLGTCARIVGIRTQVQISIRGLWSGARSQVRVWGSIRRRLARLGRRLRCLGFLWWNAPGTRKWV